MAWGIRLQTHPHHGVNNIDAAEHIYKKLSTNKKPGRPDSNPGEGQPGHRIPVPAQGEYPTKPGIIKTVKNIQYITVFNIRRTRGSGLLAVNLWAIEARLQALHAALFKVAAGDNLKEINPDDLWNFAPPVETIVQLDDGREWQVDGEFELVGRPSTYQPEEQAGRIYDVRGKTPNDRATLLPDGYKMADMEYDLESMHTIKIWHVIKGSWGDDQAPEGEQGSGNEDDPACWAVVDGVSTYICGCN